MRDPLTRQRGFTTWQGVLFIFGLCLLAMLGGWLESLEDQSRERAPEPPAPVVEADDAAPPPPGFIEVSPGELDRRGSGFFPPSSLDVVVEETTEKPVTCPTLPPTTTSTIPESDGCTLGEHKAWLYRQRWRLKRDGCNWTNGVLETRLDCSTYCPRPRTFLHGSPKTPWR